MSGCCDPRGCDQFFRDGFARKMARAYRRRGLDRTSRRMVAFLAEQGVQGSTVMEIGGGVGEIQIELLKRGAERTVNLELVSVYDGEARRLLAEAGLEDRAERRLHDIAMDPDGVEPVDVVVLHRVVCCYPDYERLLGAAADHARRLLVFSHPPRNVLARALVTAENLWFRVRGSDFRTFAHPPAAMIEVLTARGLQPRYAHHGLIWQVAGLAR